VVPPLLLPPVGRCHVRPSFPTRRSSDLRLVHALAGALLGGGVRQARDPPALQGQRAARGAGACAGGAAAPAGARRATLRPGPGRSEEHTSELQSRENLVCRLLLEKKKEC